MRILLLDNYDSFTYNLYHYLREFCKDVTVVRNDEITLEESDVFTHFVLSPGPGLPQDAGILKPLIARHADKKPMLGICLGMQAIAEHFGAELYNQKQVKHGVTTTIYTEYRNKLFNNLPTNFTVGLYHSWAVDESTLPEFLRNTAKSEAGILMAIEHKFLPLAGVQFHPESILTEHGKAIIKNWLVMAEPRKNKDPLHGVKLADILEYLYKNYGWDGLGNLIDIRCFQDNPSVKSSLKFLRKTPWARSKVEELYLKTRKRELKKQSANN